jgi:UDP-N-acetylglucosamine 2-epimerase (non-hydrolysing)
MPEEINRILTDALSDLLFVTEEDATVNLKNEGIPSEKVHFVGNVMIDTLLVNLEKAERVAAPTLQKYSKKIKNGYALVTLHRPSNVDVPETLRTLKDCLRTIAANVPIVFPLHPRTKMNLEKFGFYEEFTQTEGILLTEPLGYLEFLGLLKSARLVLTDSGGIQEEATFLRIPCVTLREATERPVTVKLGTNYVVGTDKERILKTVHSVLDGNGKKGEVPPLWDGKAGKRIIETFIDTSKRDQSKRTAHPTLNYVTIKKDN